MYKYYFYQTPRGDVPVKDFIISLQEDVQGKILKWISLLQEHGPALKRPYADKLRDKIYELRLSFGRLEIRILYFFWNNNIIFINGFLKKTQKIVQLKLDATKM